MHDGFSRIVRLYHFTDIRNIPLIKQYEGLFSLDEIRKKNIQVPAFGGNQWSHEADTRCGMDKYVHLCFFADHPMAYLAKKDGRISEYRFLNISREILRVEGVMYCDGVANRADVSPVNVVDAIDKIDFEVICGRTDWKNPTIQERLQRAKKCEILVPSRVPLKLIGNL